MGLVADPASYRDPDARVFHDGARVLRVFSPRGAAQYRAFLDTGLSDRFCERGDLVASRPLDVAEVDALDGIEPASAGLVVEHPRIPFLSYCFEWSFQMLREAALLELRLARESLERGQILKDATPYNVQFIGARPVHIDVGSFEPWTPGTPWPAYTQFCRLFLNPLILAARLGVPFHPWLRGAQEGISPETMCALLPWHKRGGAWRDVVVHAWLNRRFAGASPEAAREARAATVSREMILGTMERLARTIESLDAPDEPSAWIGYEAEKPYGPEAQRFKDEFVERALSRVSPRVVWDLGCNTGRYSLMAARTAETVVAVDGDPAVVDALFRKLQEEKNERVLCLVMDLTDPSPGQGWGGRARPAFLDRGAADFCMMLSLVHHLAISANVPLERIVGDLATAAPAGVIEFVPKDDPMVRRLLSWRKDVFEDYSVSALERAIGRTFRVVDRGRVPGAERELIAFNR